MQNLRWLLPALCLALLLGWLGACSDDDDPVTPAPAGDTTAPLVVSSYPSDQDGNVSVDDSLYVWFSEAMDPTTAAGNITLAGGTVTGTSWYTDRWLAIGHSDFAGGATITLTVGTGLTDVAGNALAAAHSVEFLTESPNLILMETTPAQDDTGVLLNTGITLRFSDTVSTSEIEDWVILTTDLVLKVNFDFTAERLEGSVYLLTPTDDLPASTLIYIYVSDQITAYDGKQPEDPYLISFTTGTNVDTTPPVLIAVDPPNGATSVSPDQGYVRFTFSEPMDTDSFEPVRYNYAIMMVLDMFGGGGSEWSAANTVLTIPLPSGLPPGIPASLTFEDYRDVNGVTQSQLLVYEFKVAGTAEYVPFVNGTRFVDEIDYEEGVLDNPTPTQDGPYDSFIRTVEQLNGSFREVEYTNSNWIETTGHWEAFAKTASALQWLGWEEETIVKSNDFVPPLTILPLPINAGTWTANASVTVEGEGTYVGTLGGRVLPQQDYTIWESGGHAFVKDAWIVVRDLSATVDEVPAVAQRDTVVYAPIFGAIRTSAYEENYDEDRWRQSITWRWPWLDFMSKSAKGFEFDK